MAQIKIIRNESGSTKQILNRDIADGSSYEIPTHLWLELSRDPDIESFIISGDYIVNDGVDDLISSVGLVHVQNIAGVDREHSDITLLPAITLNAPEVVSISAASIGFSMIIGDEIYGQSRIDNYVGDVVSVQLHLCIDNNLSDRWIQFNLNYITTNGYNDKNMNTLTGTLQIGPIEVPTTPWRIFEVEANVPSSDFANGEHYLFIGIERVTATGKTAPTNNPAILRYCKEYWKKLET